MPLTIEHNFSSNTRGQTHLRSTAGKPLGKQPDTCCQCRISAGDTLTRLLSSENLHNVQPGKGARCHPDACRRNQRDRENSTRIASGVRGLRALD